MSNATAFIPRTNNIDRLNSAVIDEEIFSRNAASTEEITMGIAEDGFEIILSMLSDLSADRGAYALREAWSNAYDATLATGDMTRKIEIVLPDPDLLDTEINLTSALSDYEPASSDLKVIDHGIGMTPEDVKRYFCQYGGSKKRGEKDMVGSKGLGSKAGLAVSDSMTVRTVHDGTETLAIIERKRGRNTATVKTRSTDAENGTTITIPVSDISIALQMVVCAQNIARYNIDANLWINGKKTDNIIEGGTDYTYAGNLEIGQDENGEAVSFRTWIRTDALGRRLRSADLNLAGVRYPLAKAYSWSSSDVDVIVAGDPGYLNFTPSRDEIKNDQYKKHFADAVLEAANNVHLDEVVNDRLAACKDFAEIREWVGKTPMYFNLHTTYPENESVLCLGDYTVREGVLVKDGTDYAKAFDLDSTEKVMVFGKLENTRKGFTYFTKKNDRRDLDLSIYDESSLVLRQWNPKTTIAHVASHKWPCELAVIVLSDPDELRLFVVHEAEIRRQIGNYCYIVALNPEFGAAEDGILEGCPRFRAAALIESAREAKRNAAKDRTSKRIAKVEVPDMGLYKLSDISTITELGSTAITSRVVEGSVLKAASDLSRYALATGLQFSAYGSDSRKLAIIATLAKAAGDLDADYLLIPSTSRISNAAIDILVENGAKLFCDRRTNVKTPRKGIIDGLGYITASADFSKVSVDITDFSAEMREGAFLYGISAPEGLISRYDGRCARSLLKMAGSEALGRYGELLAAYAAAEDYTDSYSAVKFIDRNAAAMAKRDEIAEAVEIAANFYYHYSFDAYRNITASAKKIILPALLAEFAPFAESLTARKGGKAA